MTHLLLVDDNPNDRALAIRTLRGALPDLTVLEISGLPALQRALHTSAFDVAVIDYQLLWSDGLTVLRTIKARQPDCPVVMFSDSATVEDAVAAMKEGLDDYVAKSRRHAPRLPVVVQAVLERSRAYRAAREAQAQAESALQRSHERFALAASAVQAIIYEWDLVQDTIERTAGLQEVLGYPPELSAKTDQWWLSLIHPDEREQVERAVAAALAREPQFTLEYRVRHQDGSYRWVWDRAVIVRNTAGRALRAVGSTIDISVRKQLEEQLRHAQRMESVGRLAGGVAHDFNNLLTVIQGYAELGLAELQPGQPSYAELAEIFKAAGRATVITRRLLAYARRQPLAAQLVDLNALVHDMAPLLRRALAPACTLHLELAPSPLVVRADPSQIEQVLINLAVNARDAMPNGGSLTLTTAQAEPNASFRQARPGAPHALLTMRDTGVGMDSTTQAHLFEPFFTTKEPGKGTGLGLAMCYGIVTQHGGAIWAQSAVGAGTTFTVALPLDEGKPHERALEGVSALPAGGSETVLVVDDEPAICAFVARVLTSRGYRAHAAGGAAEALSLAADLDAGALHLVVTDEVMPDLRGGELIKRIRALHPQLRALIISCYPIALDDALRPTVQVLPKPFTSGALLAAVRAALDMSPPA